MLLSWTHHDSKMVPNDPILPNESQEFAKPKVFENDKINSIPKSKISKIESIQKYPKSIQHPKVSKNTSIQKYPKVSKSIQKFKSIQNPKVSKKKNIQKYPKISKIHEYPKKYPKIMNNIQNHM